MAEVTAMRNNVLPYPIYSLPYTFVFPVLDADGDLVTGGTSDTPDSELSKNGDTFTDCTEAVEIATASGMYYISLTAAEMTCNVGALIFKTATAGTKTTPIVFYPRVLPVIRSATAQAGAVNSITLDASASAVDDYYNGCVVYISAGTGAGQVRTIYDYTGASKVALVSPNWTAPANDSTFYVYLTDNAWLNTGHLDAPISTVDTVVDGIQTDLSNGTDGLGALKALIDAITAAGPTKAEMDTAHALLATEAKQDIIDTVVDGIQTDLSNGTDGLGALKALIDAVQTQVDTTGVELTAAAVDAIWDETITADDHSTANSPALYLRQLWTTLVTRVAQCGDAGSATTIDLDAAASAVTDFYKGQLIAITSGTGVGQARACTAYNGTSKVATIGPAWATNPDGDSWFAVLNIGSTVVASIEDIDFGATMKASIETACDSSLTSYDAPTKTEMDTAHALLATPAQVNAQVLDCLVTDTHAELASVPAATSSLKDKINWLFALARNKITQTSTTQTLRNNADDADIAASTVGDDGTTATRGKFS